jgi:hypothetical protein
MSLTALAFGTSSTRPIGTVLRLRATVSSTERPPRPVRYPSNANDRFTGSFPEPSAFWYTWNPTSTKRKHSHPARQGRLCPPAAKLVQQVEEMELEGTLHPGVCHNLKGSFVFLQVGSPPPTTTAWLSSTLCPQGHHCQPCVPSFPGNR